MGYATTFPVFRDLQHNFLEMRNTGKREMKSLWVIKLIGRALHAGLETVDLRTCTLIIAHKTTELKGTYSRIQTTSECASSPGYYIVYDYVIISSPEMSVLGTGCADAYFDILFTGYPSFKKN